MRLALVHISLDRCISVRKHYYHCANPEFRKARISSSRIAASRLQSYKSSLRLYDVSIYNLAIIASRLHLVWIASVCGKLETRFSYSNTMGWNTFPLPTLTEKNKEDLTRCAEDIFWHVKHIFQPLLPIFMTQKKCQKICAMLMSVMMKC